MSKIDCGGAAFPRSAAAYSPDDDGHYEQDGMSLRDYFAGKALNGIMAGLMSDLHQGWHGWGPDAIAKEAYGISDAMIAARKAGAE